jgi:hypothetical protein
MGEPTCRHYRRKPTPPGQLPNILVAADPATFLAHLASSLNTLGDRLSLLQTRRRTSRRIHKPESPNSLIRVSTVPCSGELVFC